MVPSLGIHTWFVKAIALSCEASSVIMMSQMINIIKTNHGLITLLLSCEQGWRWLTIIIVPYPHAFLGGVVDAFATCLSDYHTCVNWHVYVFSCYCFYVCIHWFSLKSYHLHLTAIGNLWCWCLAITRGLVMICAKMKMHLLWSC